MLQVVEKVPAIANQLKIVSEGTKNKEYGKLYMQYDTELIYMIHETLHVHKVFIFTASSVIR